MNIENPKFVESTLMKFKILFVFAILLLSCTQEKKTAPSLLQYIPENAAIIIRINDLSTFKSELTNNDFLSQLKETAIYNTIIEKVEALEYFTPTSESLLAFSKQNDSSFEFIYVTAVTPNLFQLENSSDKTVETITIKNKSFDKYVIDGCTFYSIILDEKIIISSSQVLIEHSILNSKTIKTTAELEKLYAISDSKKSSSIFINAENIDTLIASQLKETSKKNASLFTDWISVDLNTSHNYVHLNGTTTVNDSIKNYLDLFKNTTPLTSVTPSYAPINADAILAYTFNDYSTFLKNKQKYLNNSLATDSIFNTVEEIGIIYLNKKRTVLLNTYGSESIIEFINSIKKTTYDYQGNEIIELNDRDFLNTFFNPIIKDFSSNYCAVLENAFIFSTDKESLQTIISNFKNSTTFDRTPVFMTAKEVLASEATILFIANSKEVEKILAYEFSETFSKDFKKADFSKYTFATQIISDINFYHTNTIVQKIEQEIKRNTTSPLFTIQLDNVIATNPQFVTNHRNKKKEVVIQDEDNNLYLISTQGKVLWKKQLNGRIQGKIHQVDLYKNGRLQLAFTTDNQFLILDRNGDEVPPFNKTYEGGNLNALAVFDYENKKDYRFVVTQGEKIFMYNNKAEIVSGFTYNTSESPIISAPQHFRIQKKDYLVFLQENNTLKILNRIGNDRIKVSQKIDFSENEVKLYRDKFTLTDKKGILYQFDKKGKVATTNLNLNKYHGLDATSKTLVYINENILSIKGKKVELELGVYSKPKIFYIYDKIYVSVTDIQNQKIYLFDSNAKPIPNFPVFGTSLIDMADIDNDKRLELVAKDADNSLIVYKIN